MKTFVKVFYSIFLAILAKLGRRPRHCAICLESKICDCKRSSSYRSGSRSRRST